MKKKFSKEKKIVHTHESQIVCDLFNILGRDLSELMVAEFGAWDGVHKSNIRPFYQLGCSTTVFIEANAKKFEALKSNYEDCLGVHLVNEFVSIDGANSFCSIVSNLGLKNIDFLSIDIDGNDYHIFESIDTILPDIICIEYNPTIPHDSYYVQENDFSVGRGASKLALEALATKKGYTVAAYTACNLILLKDKLVTPQILNYKQRHAVKSPEKIELYVGFDGSVFSNKDSMYLNWHKVNMDLSNLTPVPKYFRSIPESMHPLRKFGFYLWVAVNRPEKITFSNIQKYLNKLFKQI